MSIVATNKLLRHYLNHKQQTSEHNIDLQKKIFCKKIEKYFNGASSEEIHHHLLQHGLFLPDQSDKYVIHQMLKNNLWRVIKVEFQQIKEEWNGPDVPVFIFPANRSRELRVNLNGMSGLAHQDKVFLFVSDFTTTSDLKALITHEYNHVCRLSYLNQQEDSISLLDSIILEGLAEHAVGERVGPEYLGKWTDYYSREFAQDAWRKWVKPNVNIPKKERKHMEIMYGKKPLPKWLGYNIGYHIVASYRSQLNKSIHELIHTPAERILAKSDFI